MGFWSNLVLRRTQPGSVLSQNGGWGSLFDQTGAGSGIPLGTARWMAPEATIERFRYPGSPFDGRIWIGEGLDWERSPLGYEDDRHVCLISGSRGGKGVGVLVPNLCFWPGSCIVVDPKGENATVTARRRGGGSIYTEGIGQKVCILDPFGEVSPLKTATARPVMVYAVPVIGRAVKAVKSYSFPRRSCARVRRRSRLLPGAA
jgi:Type IV secretory system Conjugative DNA transfer